MNVRVTLYQSTTYFVESDDEDQALAYIKANPEPTTPITKYIPLNI